MMEKGTKKRAIITVISCTFLLTIGQLFWKQGVENIVLENIASFFSISMIVGVTLYGISSLLVLYALKHGELSVVYPILATSYVWVSLISPIVFHEPIKMTNLIGVVIILLGISLLGKGVELNG